MLRPAVGTERLRQRADGRIEYGLRRPWRNGTAGFVHEPTELLERLAALVPAPRGHVIRYHGVLAPNARWRAPMVRDRTSFARAAPGNKAGVAGGVGAPATAERTVDRGELRERRLSWAELMRRVFLVEALECPRCRGRRRHIGVITDPGVIAALLASVGLPTRAPPMGRAVEEEAEGWLEGEPDSVVP